MSQPARQPLIIERVYQPDNERCVRALTQLVMDHRARAAAQRDTSKTGESERTKIAS